MKWKGVLVTLLIGFLLAGPLFAINAHSGSRDRSATFEPLSVRDIEQIILDRVNEERSRLGLASLRSSSALSDAARAQSAEMASRKELTHMSAKAGDACTRIRKVLLDKKTAAASGSSLCGENVGMVQIGNVTGYGPVGSARDVANAMMHFWLKSPGHRSNILNRHFTLTGVGVAFDGKDTFYITQDFS